MFARFFFFSKFHTFLQQAFVTRIGPTKAGFVEGDAETEATCCSLFKIHLHISLVDKKVEVARKLDLRISFVSEMFHDIAVVPDTVQRNT